MRPSRFSIAAFASSTLLFLPVLANEADQSQSIQIPNAVQIAGGELTRGTYSFSVEDRLPDRAIVRVMKTGEADRHYLLAVPNRKLKLNSGELGYFKGTVPVAQAWKCASCSAPLEFVYPKQQAVKILQTSTQPVLAVDPAHDKLPENITPDDMKVVTLWLLSPERLAADGSGVKVTQYSSNTPNQIVASARHRSQLPDTASNNFTFVACGFGSLLAAFSINRWRRRAA